MRETIVGDVKIPPTAARAYRASAQNIAGASTWTKVSVDTVSFDPGNNFNVGTYHRYVAPISGFYQVTGQVLLVPANTSVYYASAIYVNGAEHTRGTHVSSSATTLTLLGLPVTAFADLNLGDYVELYGFTDGAANAALSVSSVANFLAIHRVD